MLGQLNRQHEKNSPELKKDSVEIMLGKLPNEVSKKMYFYCKMDHFSDLNTFVLNILVSFNLNFLFIDPHVSCINSVVTMI